MNNGIYTVKFDDGEIFSSYKMNTMKDACRLASNRRKGRGYKVLISQTGEVVMTAANSRGVY